MAWHATLEQAVRNDEPLFMQYLIQQHSVEFGAQLFGYGAGDPASATCLHVAAHAGAVRCARWLLENGADPAVQDDGGMTAQERAERSGFHAIRRVFDDASPRGGSPSLALSTWTLDASAAAAAAPAGAGGFAGRVQRALTDAQRGDLPAPGKDPAAALRVAAERLSAARAAVEREAAGLLSASAADADAAAAELRRQQPHVDTFVAWARERLIDPVGATKLPDERREVERLADRLSGLLNDLARSPRANSVSPTGRRRWRSPPRPLRGALGAGAMLAAGGVFRVAAAQFEAVECDKAANLACMERMTGVAAADGVAVVAFPECCTIGHHYLTTAPAAKLRAAAEPADGASVARVREAAAAHGVAVAFGMLECEGDRMYNSYLVVHPSDGVVFRHRKVHALENKAVRSGDELETFEIFGWRCGVLLGYDANLPENARILALKGAEVVFVPYHTGGFDMPQLRYCMSPTQRHVVQERAGMGRIPAALWHRRREDPIPCRDAFAGKKGREWLMKWLPSRAYDNNLFVVFVNGVGIDGDEVRPGGSMLLDPDGLVLDEATALGETCVAATLRRELLVGSLAGSHMAQRRPALYGRICCDDDSLGSPGNSPSQKKKKKKKK